MKVNFELLEIKESDFLIYKNILEFTVDNMV